jgi:hypothetical protein
MLRALFAIFAITIGCCISVSTAPTAAACPSGYYQSKRTGDCVERPDSNPEGAVAICADGSYDHSETSTGECSGHGGVAQRCPCGSATAAAASSSSDSSDQPDPDTYLYMLRRANIAYTSDNLAIVNGQRICNQASGGVNAGTLVAEVQTTPGNALSFLQAAEIVVAATEQLCPGGNDAELNVWHDAMMLAGHDPNSPNS